MLEIIQVLFLLDGFQIWNDIDIHLFFLCTYLCLSAKGTKGEKIYHILRACSTVFFKTVLASHTVYQMSLNMYFFI